VLLEARREYDRLLLRASSHHLADNATASRSASRVKPGA
jgi:hypothetical protein